MRWISDNSQEFHRISCKSVTKKAFFLWAPVFMNSTEKRKKQHPKTPKRHLPSLPSPQKREERGMSCRKKKRSLSADPGSRKKCVHKKKRNQINLKRQN